ncbi:hypothetical protein AVEN_91047-1 [Araneus ventricosus]|uniref:Histone-lysine N-methyltransferase SETMAR n=1 Tax=Araneus ventricosus TaxID=182803 RepID=A0A4Y2QC46_ARAVE|nr:hypothetical protein AVEN_91047-1 [Araneus ventricosus]
MGAEGPRADQKTARVEISFLLFLDDNARPHTPRDKKEQIRRLEWERLDHPAYSPDLAPSDFHLFSALKSILSGRHFRSNEEVR